MKNGSLFEPPKKSTLQTHTFLETKIKQTNRKYCQKTDKTQPNKLKLTCSNEQATT